MTLRKTFLVSEFLLIIAGAVTMAIAQGEYWPAPFTPPLAIIAAWFVDHKRQFSLSLFWANALGLASILITVTLVMYFPSIEHRLISMANLLVYLTWIVMFTEKTPREFWWLCALSLLQVAVSSVLTVSEWYGLMLLAYFALGIWTISLFSLYRADLQLATLTGVPITSGGASGSPSPGRRPASKTNVHEAPWPVSYSRSGWQHDSGTNWITSQYVMGILGVIAAGLVLGLCIFFFTPRVWVGITSPVAGDMADPIISVTGSSEQVQLGGGADIQQSTRKVMEVRFFQGETPVDPRAVAQRWGYNEPLFRGFALDSYHRGKWWDSSVVNQRDGADPVRRVRQLMQHTANASDIRQEYILQPLGHRGLFGMHPITSGRLAYQHWPTLTMHPETGVLSKSEPRMRTEVVEYLMFGPQPPARSQNGPPVLSNLRAIEDYRPAQQEACLQVPVELARLRDWVKNELQPDRLVSNTAQSADMRTAMTLIRVLRSSDRFSYSLGGGVVDPRLDPIEDFLLQRKTGHCEYFATALALSLRVAGIPARLVNGFKGGLHNPVNQTLEVQELHAHAWVEAFIDHKWYALDPTPGDELVIEDNSNTLYGKWVEFRSHVENFWRAYVLGLDYNRQRAMFDPVAEVFQKARTDSKSFTEMLKVFWQELIRRASRPEDWLSWRGGLVAFVLMLTLVGLFYLARRLFHWLCGLWWVARGRGPHSRVYVEFFERLLKLLARQGLVPLAHQTPREFASLAARELASRSPSRNSEAVLQRLVDLFYAVRFGHVEPSPADLSHIEQMLHDLENLLLTAPAERRPAGSNSS